MSNKMQSFVVLLNVAWLAGLAYSDVIIYDKSYTIIDEYNDLPARFGPLFPLEGLRAFALMAPDVYGCDTMAPPPKLKDERFVVLMARNNCTFFEKVLNAERAGYDAAIVYNVDTDDLIEMSGDSNAKEDAHIPAMFIGYYSAVDIKNNYLYDSRMQGDFILVLNRDLPFNINTHLLIPFVAVVVFVFVGMIVMAIVKCIRHRNRVRRDRLPRRELKKLRVIKYNLSCRYETCSICLDDYIEGERLRVLPCEHTYHTKCIDPWLTNGKRNCPMCKRKIRLASRRTRRRDNSSSRSSTSSDDTTPLLNPVRNNTNGTFPQQAGDNSGAAAPAGSGRPNPFNRAQPSQLDAAISGTPPSRFRQFTMFIRRPFTRTRSPSRENILPAVSAVVDITPTSTDTGIAPIRPRVFPLPNTSTLMVGDVPVRPPPPYTEYAAPGYRVGEQSGSAPTMSSPFRRAASGEPLIGVAALPNIDFSHATSTTTTNSPRRQRPSSSRSRRGRGRDGGADIV